MHKGNTDGHVGCAAIPIYSRLPPTAIRSPEHHAALWRAPPQSTLDKHHEPSFGLHLFRPPTKPGRSVDHLSISFSWSRSPCPSSSDPTPIRPLGWRKGAAVWAPSSKAADCRFRSGGEGSTRVKNATRRHRHNVRQTANARHAKKSHAGEDTPFGRHRCTANYAIGTRQRRS